MPQRSLFRNFPNLQARPRRFLQTKSMSNLPYSKKDVSFVPVISTVIRQCAKPECKKEFYCLENSPQLYCSRLHDPKADFRWGNKPKTKWRPGEFTAMLRVIQKFVEEGKKNQEIADYLNNNGYSRKGGKEGRWTADAISRIKSSNGMKK